MNRKVSLQIAVLVTKNSFKHMTTSSLLPKIVQKSEKFITYDLTNLRQKNKSIQCVIIQNNQLNPKLLSVCLPHSENVILADGGANQIYKSQFRDFPKIRAIVGDFDTIKPQVLDYYLRKGIPIEFSRNFETNDFGKSLDYCMKKNWKQIFAFGAFGGRMDKTLAGMHLSTKFCKDFPQLQIALFGKSNVMVHIKKETKYKIKIQENVISRYGCGLISFGLAQYVKTKGFQWDLGEESDHRNLEWGQFISTSNMMNEEQCEIDSSDNIFFVAKYGESLIR